MPALFTRARIAPSFAASPNRRTTSDSLAMSPATAFALPPELSISRTTLSAASRLRR